MRAIMVVLMAAIISAFSIEAQVSKFDGRYRTGFIKPPRKVDRTARQLIGDYYYLTLPVDVMKARWDTLYTHLDKLTGVLDPGNNRYERLDGDSPHAKYVGIEFSFFVRYNLISRVYGSSAAFRAGLCEGDLLVAINGDTDIAHRDLSTDAFSSIPENDPIHLVVRRGSREIRRTVYREPLPEENVFVHVSKNTMSMRIREYHRDTDEEFCRKIANVDLHAIDSVFIDVRGNRGGYANVAFRMVSRFLNEGDTLCMTKRRSTKEYVRAYPVNGDRFREDVKVVILIDEKTASAAEIMAGCLKQKRNALLVGRRSYGKGIGQEMHYSAWHRIPITVAEFFPGGTLKIHDVGLSPDVETDFPRPASSASLKDVDVDALRRRFPCPDMATLERLGADGELAERLWPDAGALVFLPDEVRDIIRDRAHRTQETTP